MDRFGPKIGATQLGGSVYELPPGQSICPYHYEYPEEEWLLVARRAASTCARPRARRSSGRWRSCAFPFGPEGAHKVTNRGRRDRARA